MLAAAGGRLASQQVSPTVMFAGVMLTSVIGPIGAVLLHPAGVGPAQAALAGTLFPLARPMPLDYLAGALIGLPLGLWWAGSMLERHDVANTAKAS
jgi:hypothetical protein